MTLADAPHMVRLIACTLLGISQCFAAPVPSDKPDEFPNWWFERDVIKQQNQNPTPSWPVDFQASDEAARATVAQLREISRAAAAELEAKLPGGAGVFVASRVAEFSQPLTTQLGVSALQSSTLHPLISGAAKAIDSDPDERSTAHTELEQDPWWQLDLVIPHELAEVEISSPPGQLSDFYVFIASRDMRGRSLAELLADDAVWKSPKITESVPGKLVIPAMSRGRFIMIRGEGVRELVLAEVAVREDESVPVTVGELRSMAHTFYDRLIRGRLAAAVPWAEEKTSTVSSAIATVGELRKVFSFDVARDSDSDGLPDLWEITNSTAELRDFEPADDPDGDRRTNLQEYLAGSSPHDPLNGAEAVLKLVGKNEQSGGPNTWTAEPLRVQVLNNEGVGARDQVVTFAVTNEAPRLAATTTDQPAKSVEIRTNADGIAQIHCRLPDALLETVRFTATYQNKIVEFRVWTVDQDGPAAPENLRFTLTAEGHVQIDWEDKSDDEAGFVVARSVDGRDWKEVARLPANTRSWSDQDATRGLRHQYVISSVY